MVRISTVAHYPRYAGVTGITLGGPDATDDPLGGPRPAVIVENDIATHGHAPEENHAVLDDLLHQTLDVTL